MRTHRTAGTFTRAAGSGAGGCTLLECGAGTLKSKGQKAGRCLDFNEWGQNQVELRFETTPTPAGGFGSISVLNAPSGGHVKFCRLALEVQRLGWWRRGVLADSIGSCVTLPNPGATCFAQSSPLGLFCHSEACHFHMWPSTFYSLLRQHAYTEVSQWAGKHLFKYII